MANEVMQSLFGLNSQQVADALRQRQRSEDIAYAQMDPRQQIIFNARQAGRSLGSGINQLFGLVPEALQRPRLIEKALAEVQMSGVDLSDPVASAKALAEGLTKYGLHNEAAMVMQQLQSNMPDYLRAQAALIRAQDDERDKTLTERQLKALVQVQADINAGVEPDKQLMALALQGYHKRVAGTTHSSIDQFGQLRSIHVPGDTSLAYQFPGVAALYNASLQKPEPVPTATVTPPGGAPSSLLAPATGAVNAPTIAAAPVTQPAVAPKTAPATTQTAAAVPGVKQVPRPRLPAQPAVWTAQSKHAYEAAMDKYRADEAAYYKAQDQSSVSTANALTTQGRAATKPYTDALATLADAQVALSLVQQGNEAALPQLQRLLTHLAKDSQIGQSEVKNILGSSGIVGNFVEFINTTFTGIPTQSKLKQVGELLAAFEDKNRNDYNKAAKSFNDSLVPMSTAPEIKEMAKLPMMSKEKAAAAPRTTKDTSMGTYKGNPAYKDDKGRVYYVNKEGQKIFLKKKGTK